MRWGTLPRSRAGGARRLERTRVTKLLPKIAPACNLRIRNLRIAEALETIVPNRYAHAVNHRIGPGYLTPTPYEERGYKWN